MQYVNWTDERGVDNLIEAAGVRNTLQTTWDAFEQGESGGFRGKCPMMGMLAYAGVS